MSNPSQLLTRVLGADTASCTDTLQASSEASSSQQGVGQQWDASRPATTGFTSASPFAAWSPAQPELPLPPGDRANQKPPWQPVSRSPSQGPGRKGSSTIPAGRLLSTSASLLTTADHTPPSGGRLLPTRRDREGALLLFCLLGCSVVTQGHSLGSFCYLVAECMLYVVCSVPCQHTGSQAHAASISRQATATLPSCVVQSCSATPHTPAAPPPPPSPPPSIQGLEAVAAVHLLVSVDSQEKYHGACVYV